MVLRHLVFYNYDGRFWNGAVKVTKEEIDVGDVLILGDCRRPGLYPEVVEVCVIANMLEHVVEIEPFLILKTKIVVLFVKIAWLDLGLLFQVRLNN